MKKIVLILFIGLVSNVSFAQLTVVNDNYIYVDDVVVFVEDDVKLDGADDYIYLRNEAQLIQGTGTTGNTGVGQLSVFQTGTVNNFAYNYWGSPVGNTDADVSTNRAFRADNNFYYDTGNVDKITSLLAGYYIGSANGYNGTSSPLVIADYWLYTFNPGAAYGDWDPIGSTGEAVTGYGFTMKGVIGGNQKYDFRGKPNTGTIEVDVVLNNFTLVGNPYPSAIYANAFIWDAGDNTTNLNSTLYFWEQDQTVSSHNIAAYVGGYATYTITADGDMPSFTDAPFNTYNGDGSLNTAGSPRSGSKTVKTYLPVGQGFMILGDVTGKVQFNNSMRFPEKQSGGNSEFFRPAPADSKNTTTGTAGRTENSENTTSENGLNAHGHPIIEYNDLGYNIVPSDYRRFRVNVDFNDLYTRQLLMNFHNTATDGFDRGLESQSASSLTTDANWMLDDVPYVAQAFQLEEELKIPLVVKIASPQTVRFRMFDIQNFEDIQEIFIHDIETDSYYDLKTQNYEVFLETGNYTNRFEITFEQGAALDLEDEYASQLQLFQNNSQSEVTILNPNSLEIKDFKLYDINGRLILSKNNLELKSKYKFNTSNLSSGIYIANIKLGESDVLISKKVLINNN